MGTGYRVFLVDQGDQLHKISQKRFKDFLDRRELVLEPFIGQDKVRYANVVYETDRRKPSAIIHEGCGSFRTERKPCVFNKIGIVAREGAGPNGRDMPSRVP